MHLKDVEPLIDILAFLGALGDYSYMDRLGNAIDEITMIEAIRDAIRAYFTVLSGCESRNNKKYYRIEENKFIECLEIDPKGINRAVDEIAKYIGSLNRVDKIRFAREISMKAYSKTLIYKNRILGGENK